MSVDIRKSMTSQSPTPHQISAIEFLREDFIDLGEAIQEIVPTGRAQSVAITNLEQSLMWAVKGLVGADQ